MWIRNIRINYLLYSVLDARRLPSEASLRSNYDVSMVCLTEPLRLDKTNYPTDHERASLGMRSTERGAVRGYGERCNLQLSANLYLQ